MTSGYIELIDASKSKHDGGLPLRYVHQRICLYIYTYCFWTSLLSNLTIHAPMYLTMHLHIYNICTYSRNMCIYVYI